VNTGGKITTMTLILLFIICVLEYTRLSQSVRETFQYAMPFSDSRYQVLKKVAI